MEDANEFENSKNKESDYHKSRIAFLIIDGDIKILENSEMSHLEWAKSIGINKEMFSLLVRGYVLDNKMVFYKGDFKSDDEVINAARIFSERIKRKCEITDKCRIYCGVIKGEIGEVWEPQLFIGEI